MSDVGCRRDSNPRYGKSNLPSLSLGNDRRMSAGRSDLAKRVRLRSPPRQQQDCSESTGNPPHSERYCARHVEPFGSKDFAPPVPDLCGAAVVGTHRCPATDGDPNEKIKDQSSRQAGCSQCRRKSTFDHQAQPPDPQTIKVSEVKWLENLELGARRQQTSESA